MRTDRQTDRETTFALLRHFVKIRGFGRIFTHVPGLAPVSGVEAEQVPDDHLHPLVHHHPVISQEDSAVIPSAPFQIIPESPHCGGC